MLKIISNNLFKGDKVVWMIFFFLCMISLVEIYSASSSLTYTHGNHFDPMIRQAGFLFVGLIIILIVHRLYGTQAKETTGSAAPSMEVTDGLTWDSCRSSHPR